MSDAQADDMNATPLSSLPPPMMTSIKDNQPTLQAPSYEELRAAVVIPRPGVGDPLAPPPPQAANPFTDANTFATQSPYLPPQPQQPQQLQQLQQVQQPMQMQMPHMAQMQQPLPAYDPQFHYPPQPTPQPDEGWFKRLVRANKSTIVVVAVVLLLLLFLVPRLARMPRFATFEGRLNVPGKVTAALLAGATYRLTLAAV